MTTRDRAWQVGFALGAVAGVAVRYVGRRSEASGGRGLIDWPRATSIAVRRLERAPGALTQAELVSSARSYTDAMERVVPLLERTLGAPLPGVVERHAVVSRGDWAVANIATFQNLLSRVEEQLVRRTAAAGGGVAPEIAALVNRFLSTQQVGLLLGYLGSRVLGQYDIALLSAESKPGRLLFVEENIRATARTLDVPLDDFRLWICLHESTHAFELEAHAWLRPYLAERIERQVTGLLDDVRSFRLRNITGAIRRSRSSSDPPLAGLLSAEQRRLLQETQVIMSVMEGFSDWVMDEIGADLIPNLPEVRRRFEARRDQRRRGIDRIIARLTGLDMKLEQYRRGERFVAGIVRLGGRDALGRLWAGPESMPSDAELDDPAAWVRRALPPVSGGA